MVEYIFTLVGKKIKNKAYGYLNSVVANNPVMHILGAITKTTSKTKNTIQFNLNETVSDIIVSSAMEYVSTYDMFSLLNPIEDSEILKAFGKNEHDYDSLEECKQILKSQGIPQSVLVNGLGSLIARNLGIHSKATADMLNTVIEYIDKEIDISNDLKVVVRRSLYSTGSICTLNICNALACIGL